VGLFERTTKAYYDYDHDSSLRAAVLFGHGENFSRGVDVDAFTELAKTGKPTALVEGELDSLGKMKRLGKPLVVVAHGDTWKGAKLRRKAGRRFMSVADGPCGASHLMRKQRYPASDLIGFRLSDATASQWSKS
jgi:hypothetical protein